MKANNNQKLYEVVKKILDSVKYLSQIHNDDLPVDVRIILGGIAFDAATALDEPPRNCDVGTAEEQDKRFTHQFCRVGIEGCIRCKLNTLQHRGNTCGIHWAQLPYKEEKEINY